MMDMPAHLLYTPDHLWVRIDGNRAMIGITEYAQEELGIVVFAELPPLGEKVRTGLYMSMVESAKQDMDIIALVSGTVVLVNQALASNPMHINTSPYEYGWILVIEMSRPEEMEKLWDAKTYQEAYATCRGE
ncbi:glycine cleavage system protein GcvH [Paenibacillus larvae]